VTLTWPARPFSPGRATMRTDPDLVVSLAALPREEAVAAVLNGGTTASVDEILDRCGIHVVSDETMAALAGASDPTGIGEESVVQLQWRIALSSPEFQQQ
jgi:hypothetical protein